MAKLSYKQRQKLPASSFVFPGKRAYPLDTKSRARNALARVSQFGSPEEKATVRRKVYSRYPGIKQSALKKKGVRLSSFGPGGD